MPEYGFSVNISDLASAKMKEIEASMASMGVKAKVETKEVESSFVKMGERLEGVFGHLKSLFLTGLGITALFEGWEFIEKSKDAFEGLEKQVARLDTVLKSTNFKAGFSSLGIQEQAKEISKTIVNSRQEILQAQGTLLSYTNLRGNVFKKALVASADYSTFFGTDLASGARIFGRALQDPLQGMNQLRRAGIVLSAQQKESIKNYEQSGHLVKAQAVLLDEINKKFGGQAQAFALTDAGKIQVARKQWEEMEFKIGEIVSRIEVSLIPLFTEMVTDIKNAFNSETIQFFINHIKDLIALILRAIPTWVIYKGLMLLNAGATELMALRTRILGTAIAETAAEQEIANAKTASAGSIFSKANIWLAAFAITLGIIVKELNDYNDKIDEAADKMTHLSEIRDRYKPLKDANDEMITKFNYAQTHKLGASVEGAFLSDALKQKKDSEDAMNNDILPKIDGAKSSINNLKTDMAKIGAPKWVSGFTDQGAPTMILVKDKYTDRRIDDARQLAAANKNITEEKSLFGSMENIIKNAGMVSRYYLRKGIKPTKYEDPNAGAKLDAMNTSLLSGASGGLGQAKIINFYFHAPLQQNIGVKESKEQSEKAIEKITEMLGGFSDSQNSQ